MGTRNLINIMTAYLPSDWKKKLNAELEKPYFKELLSFVQQEYLENECYPEKENIFKAFELCPFENTKVVIIGQDPYHGKGQAHGLCFSVQPGVKIPSSLKNIYRELNEDIGKPIPHDGNLEHWAEQGVLMLNATLTVRKGQAGSHFRKGWEKFTDAVIQILSEEKENVVFLLWGGPAHKKGRKIDESRHQVLRSGHPSPLSANRGYWFGNKHFSKTNEFLRSIGERPVEW